MFHSKKYQKQNRWEEWVHKPIFASQSVSAVAPRHIVIRDFVERGLFPFVKAKGYVFAQDVKGVTLSLLRYLFALYEGDKVIFKNPHKDWMQDHFDEFEHRFDSLELEEFWERWGSIEDFQEQRYGETLRYTLPCFLWPSINLKRSPIFEEIENAIDEMEDWEQGQMKKESKGKEDAYLQDTSKVNYEDRHWH